MPFNPPFKNRFEKGDLVFGLSSVRHAYFDTPDGFSDVPLLDLIRKGEVVIIDQYAATKLEIQAQRLSRLPIPPRQSDFLRMVQSHPKYQAIWSAKGSMCSGRPAFTDEQTVIGRKCKAGLLWAAMTNTTVHFVLDGLDLECVINKSGPPKKVAEAGHKPYTGCELRWIYRNRMFLQVQQCVQFWLNDMPTSPPWIQFPHLWENYDRDRRTMPGHSLALPPLNLKY